jgi:acid phosphatase family membrane protein YuiD
LSGLGYALVCPMAYLSAGSLKFAVNSVRAGRLAFGQIGLGGFPSTHTSVVSSAAWLVAFNRGIDDPAFAIAVALTIIVMIDATDLRRKLGRVNSILKTEFPASAEAQKLRDRTGHSLVEIAGGLVVGAIVAAVVGHWMP